MTDATDEAGSSISMSWDNLASRAIAAKLRLIPYTETLSLH
jgi:hypothetical protein